MYVETSIHGFTWEKDARYEYYQHGPLARTILGEQLVQGIDYAYTLQGWLKGVNSMNLDSSRDIGEDGLISGLNRYTAKDVYSFQLNYFAEDYYNINSSLTPFPAYKAALGANYKPLYNGNISSMGVNIGKLNDLGSAPLFYNYKYDQLNRLTAMDVYNGFNSTTTNSWTGMTNPGYYKERVAYDANGNITKYLRHGHGWSQQMDSLSYYYYAGTNRLQRVIDSVPVANYGNNSWDLIRDIDKQDSIYNYKYDSIGNLVVDISEKITSIKWSVYGKILEINRTATTFNPTTKINYTYDPSGNRISKIVKKGVSDPIEYTWYVRDAQGNLMSIYSASGGTDLSALYVNQVEKYIYGSSRLGVYKWPVPAETDTSGLLYDLSNLQNALYTRGHRSYELTNHLGNVLVTITDKKIGVPVSGSNTLSHFTADVVMAQDYYPFGMMMPGREYQAQPSRFGFNGKENDNDVKGFGNQEDYGMRVYDTRIGKFLSVDPLQKQYPELTPYQFSGNTPIQAVDLDGRETVHYLLIFHNDNRKPTLQYQGIQTREFAWFESFDSESPATRFKNADGDRITTFKIKVWLTSDEKMNCMPWDKGTVGKYTETKEFTSANEFLGWVGKGLPNTLLEAIGPVDTKTQEQVETATTLLINEMYFNYEMQDGSFDFDSPPDISRFFSKGKSTPTEKINEQTTASHNGNRNAAESNKAVSKTQLPEWGGPVDYSSLKQPNKVGPGFETTPTQRLRILEHNKKMNGGILRSDIDGTVLDMPTVVPAGGKANMNQAEVDHILPRVNGGSNSNSNVRVISKKQNLEKESSRRKK